MASFSLRNFDRDNAIAMTRRANLDYICFKDMHLPMNATDEECAAAAEECRRAGLTLYACGVVYMNSTDEVHNTFRYARAAGLNTIVAVPQPDLLPLIEEKTKETDIYIAIHNAAGSGHYRTPAEIMEKIGSLDRRVGICLDIGNAARAGDDVVKSIRDYKDRIHDIHLKDETEATLQGRNCIFGRGVLDLPSYFAALLEVGYDRIASIEYEAEANDPLPGIMESLGYVRGIMRMLTGARI
jgi:sugar phosphate isomerase/epimerase